MIPASHVNAPRKNSSLGTRTKRTRRRKQTYLLRSCCYQSPSALQAPPSFEKIETLAGEFQSTLTSTVIRYVQLCEWKCPVVCSSNSRVSWLSPGPDFHYWIKRGALKTNSYAVDFFDKGPDAAEMRELQEVPRNAWIEGESMQDLIAEQSRPLTSYGSALTLLWIQD